MFLPAAAAWTQAYTLVEKQNQQETDQPAYQSSHRACAGIEVSALLCDTNLAVHNMIRVNMITNSNIPAIIASLARSLSNNGIISRMM